MMARRVASYTGSWRAGRAWVTFEGEIFYELVKNTILMEKIFTDCSFVAPKDAMLPTFVEKSFVNNHKTSK